LPLRILIVCPAPPGSRHGNRVTALRWARVLRSLGCAVRIDTAYGGQRADLLVALHARRSAKAVRAFRRAHPRAPLVVALTGTDLYHDLGRSRAAARSLELADRLVLLQAEGRAAVPAPFRRKARVIYQSVERPRRRVAGAERAFRICVMGHLRAVKDPLRPALAVRQLPRHSRIEVIHLGGALDARLARLARAESRRNPRYRWLGERPRAQALRLLAGSHLLVHPSRMEGGANAIGEAVTLGVPVLASAVPGNTGLLGSRHPGLFPVGDTRELRRLMLRAEQDPRYRARLARASARLAPRFDPAVERRSWSRLLHELDRSERWHGGDALHRGPRERRNARYRRSSSSSSAVRSSIAKAASLRRRPSGSPVPGSR
jgi:putative glycosyltransferase (TIGR04348 family)